MIYLFTAVLLLFFLLRPQLTQSFKVRFCTSALASATIAPVAVIVVAVVLKSIACAGVTSIRTIAAITVIFISQYPA